MDCHHAAPAQGDRGSLRPSQLISGARARADEGASDQAREISGERARLPHCKLQPNPNARVDKGALRQSQTDLQRELPPLPPVLRTGLVAAASGFSDSCQTWCRSKDGEWTEGRGWKSARGGGNFPVVMQIVTTAAMEIIEKKSKSFGCDSQLI